MKKTIVCSLFLSFSFLFFGSFLVPNHSTDDKYKQGYYFDGTQKVEGYIYFTFDNYERFFFKKEPEDKRVKKTVLDCQGFFVDGKKFVVINGIDLKIGVWNIRAEQAFAEVIIEGPLNLYKVYSMVGNANMSAPGAIDVVNFFLEKNSSKSYVLAHPNKAKFKKGLSELLKDREDIVEKIKNGEYNIINIEGMVKDYNYVKP